MGGGSKEPSVCFHWMLLLTIYFNIDASPPNAVLMCHFTAGTGASECVPTDPPGRARSA